MNVLIVDDDVPYLRTIREGVRWQNLSVGQVYTASNTQEALTLLEERQIDLLITDIEMPGKSGLSLIEWCKEQNLSMETIILSSFPDFSYAQKAIALGVSAYLLKTADRETLEDMIRRTAVRMLQSKDRALKEVKPRQSHYIEKIRHYVAKHITEEISRDALAEHVGFTPEYLSSYFKKETGKTLGTYINCEKIEFSKRMLLQTDLPVSVIAQNIGFETSSYFTALFKKTTGVTPREYRKVTYDSHSIV